MKTMMLILLLGSMAQADSYNDVKQLAMNNQLKPSERVINAIVEASSLYNIDPLELTAIGIIETGLGKYTKSRHNKNGTLDKGLFQINTINVQTCIEYNLDSPEGSSLCAAKLLSTIKNRFKKDKKAVARYHSGTPKYKNIYFNKITKVFLANAE